MSDLTFSPDVLALNPGLTAEKAVPASKYHNVREEAHGLRFASGHEASVISSLILMEEQHRIGGLRLQVRFPLPGGIVYVADATYYDLDPGLPLHVIDAKGYKTREYKNKKKLFEATYHRRIEEV